jgi:hypothetical protein
MREKPVGEATFARSWASCLASAGVAYRSPHTARHTFATRWRRRGLAIRRNPDSARTFVRAHDGRFVRPYAGRRRGRAHGPNRGEGIMSLRSTRGRRPANAKGRGAERIRTAVRGFAGPCLTTRPPRRSHHRTPALARKFAGLPGRRQNEWPPSDANLVPGLMPRRSDGAPDPYRGSAIGGDSLGVFEVLLRAGNTGLPRR